MKDIFNTILMSSHRVFAVVVGLGLIFWSFNLFSVEPARSARIPVKTETRVDLAIKKLQEQHLSGTTDENSLVALSELYLQKVRETADTSFYGKAETLLSQLEALNPKNSELYGLRSAIALGKHNFAEAIPLATKALELSPGTSRYMGMLVDAYNELGQYKKAADMAQKMVDTRPDFNSFSRVSYVRELHGDIEGAKTAMESAIKAGSDFPENVAWGHVELGNLHLRTDAVKAKAEFEKALAISPDFAPAFGGLGRVALVEEDLKKMDGKTKEAEEFAKQAEAHFKKAYELLPAAQQAIDLGDFYATHANDVLRDQNYALAELAFQSAEQGGTDVELEYAFFLADHGRDLSKALALAQSAYKKRPSIAGADTLAWAFLKNGKVAEAEATIKKALILGEHDAQVLYHAGAIALEKNDIPKVQDLYTKSLKLSQMFSILHFKEMNIKLGALFFSR